MIHLYYPENTNYEANGDVILMPYRCEATAGINRTWQIDLEHPIDNEGRWKAIKTDAVIKCPSFNGTQLWRIVQTEKNDGGVTATCDPIFYDAVHEVVFVDRITLNNMTAQQMLDRLTEGTKFSGVSHIAGTQSAWFQTENLVEAVTGNEHGLVKTFYDAEVGFDNYTVILEDELGGDYGASVVYGKNLAVDGISESVNIDGTITRIIPIAYNGHTLPELYVDSQYIDDYPFPRIGFIQYDNLRLWSEREEGEEGDSTTEYFNSLEELYVAMRAAAQLEYTDNEIDKPQVSMEVEMVLIQNTEEYKDYKDLEKVSIGDYVRCYNPRLGIDSKTRVRTLVYDCIRESVISVELGHEKRNYFDDVTSMIDRVESAITPGGTVVAEKIAGLINGAYAQLRLQNTIAKKQDVRAILFEDLDPNSPTFGALAIGTQGWQISKERTADDRDWIWTTAATSEGIIANVVVTGLLSDKLGRNYWNLDTSDFRLSGATITDADIDGYATDSELGAVDTKATNAGTAASNAQTTANNAQTAAATADGKAVAAQGTANTAITNAAAAQSTADGAVTAAGNAQTTADTAITRLNGQYGTCTTAAGTATKAVTLTNANNFELFKGATIAVKFSSTNSAASPTLKVGNTDAKPIYVKGSAISSMYYWSAGSTVTFVYNGSQWEMETDDQAMTFNHLTNGGTLQGIYMQNGELYVNASYLKSGTIEADRIAGHSLSVDKITGSITNGSWGIDFQNGTMSIGTLAVGSITGTVGDSNNYINFNNGTMNISSLNASVITAGTINAARIPNISADKITSGTLSSEGTYSESYIGGGGTYTVTDSSTITGGRVAIASEAVGIAGTIYNHIALKQGQILLSATGSKSGVYAYHNKENSYYFQSNSHTTINSEGISTYLGSYYADSGTSSLMGSALTFNSSSGKIKVAGTTVTPWAYSGERLTYSSDDGPYAGHVTTSGKQLLFFIPAKKTLTGITSVSASFPSTIEVRTTNGAYLDGSASLSTSGLTRNITLVSGGFRVSMTKSSAFTNVTNNTPVTVMLKSSMTVTIS